MLTEAAGQRTAFLESTAAFGRDLGHRAQVRVSRCTR
jgi:hypothetical protein